MKSGRLKLRSKSEVQIWSKQDKKMSDLTKGCNITHFVGKNSISFLRCVNLACQEPFKESSVPHSSLPQLEMLLPSYLVWFSEQHQRWFLGALFSFPSHRVEPFVEKRFTTNRLLNITPNSRVLLQPPQITISFTPLFLCMLSC